MYDQMKQHVAATLTEIREAGLWKDERQILGAQSARIAVAEGEVLNFCANNYLGLSSHEALLEAAHEGLDRYGFGMSSVRFICGTQDQHKTLTQRVPASTRVDPTCLPPAPEAPAAPSRRS